MTTQMSSKSRSEPAPLALDRSDERVNHADGLTGLLKAFIGRVRSGDLGMLPVAVGLIVISTVFSILNPIFLAPNNLVNLLFDCATVGIISLGIVCVLILGEIDLSVGSIIAVAGMVGAQCFAFGLGFAPAIVLTLLAGALMGMLNGVLTAKLLLPSFIVTVATMGIYRGMVSLPTNGAPAMIENPTWTAIGTESFLGLPIIIWVVAVLFLVNHILLSKTSFGRRRGGLNREDLLLDGIVEIACEPMTLLLGCGQADAMLVLSAQPVDGGAPSRRIAERRGPTVEEQERRERPAADDPVGHTGRPDRNTFREQDRQDEEVCGHEPAERAAAIDRIRDRRQANGDQAPGDEARSRDEDQAV